MKMSDVLTKVRGKPITVKDVVDYLKVTGQFRQTIYQIIEREVIYLAASQMNIVVSDSELEQQIELRRRMLGLNNAMAMNNYCLHNGITWDQWKQFIAYELLRQKIQQVKFTREVVQKYFEENRDQLKMICLGRIVIQDRATADNILANLQTNPDQFSQFARQYSIEPNTRIAGGYLGCFKRGMLPEPIDSALFSSPEKTIVGPYSQNNLWAIYKVEEVQYAQLSDAMAKNIADKLFVEWLRKEVMNVSV